MRQGKMGLVICVLVNILLFSSGIGIGILLYSRAGEKQSDKEEAILEETLISQETYARLAELKRLVDYAIQRYCDETGKENTYVYHIIESLRFGIKIANESRHAFELINQFRTQARELMSNRQLAESLNITNPNLTWEQIIQKQIDKGLTGDYIFKAIKEDMVKLTKQILERSNMGITETSKYISLILRHKPEVIGITLDEHGWAKVDDLIAGIQKTHPINREMLEEIVHTDSKQRYSFNEDGTLIRANQGHSIPVDVELPVAEPPEILWHGTGEKYAASIDKTGLLPQSRLYVHLSGDVDTAITVGKRHGKPVVYRILSGKMAGAGYTFYRSVNGVWLTKTVPVEYLEKQV